MTFYGRNVLKQNDNLYYFITSSEDIQIRKNKFVRHEFNTYQDAVNNLLDDAEKEGSHWFNAHYDPTI